MSTNAKTNISGVNTDHLKRRAFWAWVRTKGVEVVAVTVKFPHFQRKKSRVQIAKNRHLQVCGKGAQELQEFLRTLPSYSSLALQLCNLQGPA